jgi:signal transduction histidine kinase
MTAQLEALRASDGAPHAGAVASMQADALQMNAMVDNLLLLARVADPSRPAGGQVVDLVSLVEQACARASTLATLGQEITTAVPRQAVTVLGNASELGRMIDNLLLNAIRFMPYPGSIAVALTSLAREVTLTVSDDGVGIPGTELGHVFEEFYRSSNPAARDLHGTGLGLAIVSRVVHRHGGHIEVSSDINQGSTFRVFLPLAPA